MSPDPTSPGLVAAWQATAASLCQPIDLIEAGVIPAAQLHNLQYEDLIGDPVATVAAAYAHFGLTLGEPARTAIAAHLAAHPRASIWKAVAAMTNAFMQVEAQGFDLLET